MSQPRMPKDWYELFVQRAIQAVFDDLSNEGGFRRVIRDRFDGIVLKQGGEHPNIQRLLEAGRLLAGGWLLAEHDPRPRAYHSRRRITGLHINPFPPPRMNLKVDQWMIDAFQRGE